MHEQSRTAPGRTLTNFQASRLDFARLDLEAARAQDLGQLDAAKLILVIERLRGRLDDMINLVDEVTRNPGDSPKRPCGPTLFVRDNTI